MFKGELSLDDIVGMVYKKLVSLREARVKRLMEEAKEAESKAKILAAREAQSAHDATPEGKKERNIAALSILAAVLLFLLFACVFHLYGVAFIVGFVAASPYFWFRARKAGFVILAIILVVLAAKIWF